MCPLSTVTAVGSPLWAYVLPSHGLWARFIISSMNPSYGTHLKPNQKAVGYYHTAMPLLHQWVHLAWQVLWHAESTLGKTVGDLSPLVVCTTISNTLEARLPMGYFLTQFQFDSSWSCNQNM